MSFSISTLLTRKLLGVLGESSVKATCASAPGHGRDPHLGRERQAAGARVVDAVLQMSPRSFPWLDLLALKRALGVVRCVF
jgi:hypothetical protein